jgi:hypothetical protein
LRQANSNHIRDGTAAEDVTIIFRVTNGENDTSIRQKYISPGKAETLLGPDYEFITETSGKMIRIDHRRWEYYETTEQEQQAASRLLLRGPVHRPPTVSYSVAFEKLSEHRTIAGYDCEHYFVTTSYQDYNRTEPVIVNTHDYWVATDLPYLILETFRAREFENTGRILQTAPDHVIRMLLRKGLILAETWSTASGHTYSEEATEVKIEQINPVFFRPPMFYAKVESPSARAIRENANVQFPAASVCSKLPYRAMGGDDDEDVAWDATKKAWRDCVAKELGEGWTFPSFAKKQCYPREKAIGAPQGTATIACGQTGGNPDGKWACHYESVACKAPDH